MFDSVLSIDNFRPSKGDSIINERSLSEGHIVAVREECAQQRDDAIRRAFELSLRDSAARQEDHFAYDGEGRMQEVAGQLKTEERPRGGLSHQFKAKAKLHEEL